MEYLHRQLSDETEQSEKSQRGCGYRKGMQSVPKNMYPTPPYRDASDDVFAETPHTHSGYPRLTPKTCDTSTSAMCKTLLIMLFQQSNTRRYQAISIKTTNSARVPMSLLRLQLLSPKTGNAYLILLTFLFRHSRFLLCHAYPA